MISNKDSEKYLEKRLRDEIAKLGGHALKFASQTEIGYPDRLVLMPHGRAYWVEVKSKGEKPRLVQRLRHDELRALGFQVWVIDSDDSLNNFLTYVRHETNE